MSFKKIFLFLVIVATTSSNIKAQTFYKWTEFGASIGATQYFGDINDNYGFKEIHGNIGAVGRYNFNHYLSLRVSANYTQVGYQDKFNSNSYQKMRNLNFKSNIFEATVQAEFNFFRFETGNLEHEWTPYITGGIGAFYYNPYTVYKGDKLFLRPIGTEGQNLGANYSDRVYGSTALCFPIGAGIKWWLVPGVNMSIEVAHRLTNTDYLDDVSKTYVGGNKFAPDPNALNSSYLIQDPSLIINPSNPLGRAGKQRGASATRDQFLMAQLIISVQLKTYKCPSNLSYWRTQY